MIRNAYLLALFVIPFLLSGCGTWFNPYHEKYLCPDGFPGKCASVEQAYDESFHSSTEKFSPLVKNKEGCADCNQPNVNAADGQYNYKNELYKELAGIIRDPKTPVLKPATQRRVLIPGYTEDNDSIYYGYRYIYFMDRSPRWVLPAIQGRAGVE
jgi:conjugal transfer pilus assembly protein TraV